MGPSLGDAYHRRRVNSCQSQLVQSRNFQVGGHQFHHPSVLNPSIGSHVTTSQLPDQAHQPRRYMAYYHWRPFRPSGTSARERASNARRTAVLATTHWGGPAHTSLSQHGRLPSRSRKIDVSSDSRARRRTAILRVRGTCKTIQAAPSGAHIRTKARCAAGACAATCRSVVSASTDNYANGLAGVRPAIRFRP